MGEIKGKRVENSGLIIKQVVPGKGGDIRLKQNRDAVVYPL